MLDLRALSIFARVAERKSFVRAARDLGITQSGVSNAIGRLEEHLGVRLLARTTRSVGLTEDGAALFERSRQILADLDEAEQVLTQSRLTPSGRLRIDMPVCFGRLKVIPLLGAFRAKYPQIELVASSTDRFIDLVEEGIDVAIRLGTYARGLERDRAPANEQSVPSRRRAGLFRSTWTAPFARRDRKA